MNSDARSGFGKRLFLALTKTLLVAVILTALAIGGYLFVKELQRSFDSVTARVDINRREVESLRGEVAALSEVAPNQQQQIEALQAETVELETRLGALQTAIAEDLEKQDLLLTEIEEALDLAISSSQMVTEDLAAVGTAMVALQTDFNETNGRIDALGGEIDVLRARNEALENRLGDLSAAVVISEDETEASELTQTVVLFRIWELIARARFRLAQGNPGLATSDVERAFRAVDAMIATESDESSEALRVVQTRLALAFTSLSDAPATAALDLENAWDELDRILTSRLTPELDVEAGIEIVAPESEQVVTEPTPTP